MYVDVHKCVRAYVYRFIYTDASDSRGYRPASSIVRSLQIAREFYYIRYVSIKFEKK